MIIGQITDKQLNQDIKDTEKYVLNSFGSFTELPKSKNIYDRAKPQLFTNENSEYINGMNLQGKSLLSVAGGFDAIFDFIGLETEEILAIDMNRKQFYIGCLKFWSLEKLSYQEYSDFLVNSRSQSFLNFDIFKKISSHVNNDDAAKTFWNTVFRMFPQRSLLIEILFGEKQFLSTDCDRILKCNYLSSEIEYDKARANSKRAKITFMCNDITKLSKTVLDKTLSFDNIVLSNIGDYIPAETFYDFVTNKLMNSLSNNGRLMALYIIKMEIKQMEMYKHIDFDTVGFGHLPEFALVRNQLELISLFNQHTSEILSFETGNGRKYDCKEDSAIILRKTT